MNPLLMVWFVLLVAVSLPLYAQVSPSTVYVGDYEEDTAEKKSLPAQKIRPRSITDQLLHRPFYRQIHQRMEKVRQQVTRNAADSTPGPSVGDYRTFFTRDVQDMDQFYQVEATCLLVSEQLVIWIATNDRQQLPASVSVSSILNQLSNFLVNQTPATSVNPQAGILSIEQSYFGKPPVVGGSSRLNIFLLDIRDDFQQSGSYVAGFFDPVNLTDDSRSNHLNLDYSPRNLVVIKAEKKCRRKGTCVP